MKADVACHIRCCENCLSTKPELKAAARLLLSSSPQATRTWQVISIDIVGPLSRTPSGHSYIFTVCDIFSEFIVFYPLRQVTAKTVAETFENHAIPICSASHGIISDNGVQFRSNEFRELYREYDIELGFIGNDHAQANPVELVHGIIGTMLTAYALENHKTRDTYLAEVRSARHETTQLTPNFVKFIREIRLSGELEHSLSGVRCRATPLIFEPQI
ncbi:hypothetical protein JTB14_036600 [Gonioctena quinquepunctata]|nr:hypothetical protein JTB14_036600 [Gonioctena quinquepunctata]